MAVTRQVGTLRELVIRPAREARGRGAAGGNRDPGDAANRSGQATPTQSGGDTPVCPASPGSARRAGRSRGAWRGCVPTQTQVPTDGGRARSGCRAVLAAAPSRGGARVGFPGCLAATAWFPGTSAGPLCWAQARPSPTPGSFEMSSRRGPDLPGADLDDHFQVFNIHPSQLCSQNASSLGFWDIANRHSLFPEWTLLSEAVPTKPKR